MHPLSVSVDYNTDIGTEMSDGMDIHSTSTLMVSTASVVSVTLETNPSEHAVASPLCTRDNVRENRNRVRES